MDTNNELGGAGTQVLGSLHRGHKKQSGASSASKCIACGNTGATFSGCLSHEREVAQIRVTYRVCETCWHQINNSDRDGCMTIEAERIVEKIARKAIQLAWKFVFSVEDAE